jgi:hypothetical protein
MQPFDAKCPRCLEEHPIIRCPYVKAVELEYGGDFNTLRRVEFLTPADYGRAQVPQQPDDVDGTGAKYPKLGEARG